MIDLDEVTRKVKNVLALAEEEVESQKEHNKNGSDYPVSDNEADIAHVTELIKIAPLALDVYTRCLAESETFNLPFDGDEDAVGANLAYLMGALLGGTALDRHMLNQGFIAKLRDWYEADHVIWGFIR